MTASKRPSKAEQRGWRTVQLQGGADDLSKDKKGVGVWDGCENFL